MLNQILPVLTDRIMVVRFEFEQRGGRIKLVQEDSILHCSEEDAWMNLESITIV